MRSWLWSIVAVAALSIGFTGPAYGAGWLPPEDADSRDPSGSFANFPFDFQPKVAVNPAGDAVAMWAVPTTGGADLRVVRRPAGGGWGDAQTVAAVTYPTEGTGTPRTGDMAFFIGLRPDGRAVAVFTDAVNDLPVVKSVEQAPGGLWGIPEIISADDVRNADLTFAQNEDGAMVVAWTAWLSGPNQIQGSVRSRIGTWEPYRTISHPMHSMLFPSAAVGEDGTYAIAYDNNTIDQIEMAMRGPAAGDWDVFETIAGVEAGSTSILTSDISISNGHVGAAWYESRSGIDTIRVSMRNAPGSWSAPQRVSGDQDTINGPDIEVGPNGEATVAWQKENPELDEANYAYKPRTSSGFTGPRKLADTAAGVTLSRGRETELLAHAYGTASAGHVGAELPPAVATGLPPGRTGPAGIDDNDRATLVGTAGNLDLLTLKSAGYDGPFTFIGPTNPCEPYPECERPKDPIPCNPDFEDCTAIPDTQPPDPPPAPDPGCKDGRHQLVVGPIEVVAPCISAKGPGVWETSGDVRINGINLKPKLGKLGSLPRLIGGKDHDGDGDVDDEDAKKDAEGDDDDDEGGSGGGGSGLGRLVIDAVKGRFALYGDFDVRLGELGLGEWGNFSWQLPKNLLGGGGGSGGSGGGGGGTGTGGLSFPLPDLPDLPKFSKLAGFPIEGDAKFELKDKTLVGWVYAKLPSVLGVSGKLDLEANNELGLVLKNLELRMDTFFIGTVKFEDVVAAYNWATETWRGSATVTIPTSSGAAKVSGGLTIEKGAFKAAFAKADGLNIALSREVFLQRISAAVRVNPLFLGGGIGITAGPVILFGPPGGEQRKLESISLDGEMSYDWAEPGTFKMKGDLGVAGVRATGGSLTYVNALAGQPFGQLDVAADVTLPPKGAEIPGVKASAGVSGSVYGNVGFNLKGNATIEAPIIDKATGDLLISSIGAAACVAHSWGSAGFTYRWSDSDMELFAKACSFEGFEVKPVVARASAVATSFEVPEGLPAALFALTGANGPPKVDLAGPGGRRVSVPEGAQALDTGREWVIQDPDTKTTYIFVGDPAAGAWTATARAGSDITGGRFARGLPEPKVKARVTGKGARRKLTWEIAHLNGQVVHLVEEGAGSSRELAVARKARGSVAFSPAPGRGKRRLVAIVENEGMPRARLNVGAYAPPRPARPGRPKALKVLAKGKKILISFKPARGVRQTAVTIKFDDGRKELHIVKGRRLSLDRGFALKGTVTAAGFAPPRTMGPAAKAKLGVAKRKKKKGR